MNAKTAYESSLAVNYWENYLVPILYGNLVHRLEDNGIEREYIYTEVYSFFQVALRNCDFIKVRELIMELDYSPKIVNEFEVREYHYIHVLFSIEEDAV
jgi:hypothetical protein